jgi:hypothetical protein
MTLDRHSPDPIPKGPEVSTPGLCRFGVKQGQALYFCYTEEELGLRQAPLSGVFGVENAGHSWEALQQAVDRVVAIIQSDPNKDRTDRIITRWLKRHLTRLGAGIHLNQLDSLVEDRDMLAENLENLVKKERLEGRQEGREEGQHEARKETARNLINRTEMNDQMIAEIAGLAMEEVGALRSEIKH